MDRDRQVKLDFLEEAEEYFDRLESILVDLDSLGINIELLDTAMRSAHSLKGGAAMMGFVPLSKTAHRLEDFLKILRVRRDSSLLDREVTTLLLEGVDCLRAIRNLHYDSTPIQEQWLQNNVRPIFDRLQQKLGDLQEADEDLLLAEEEKVDVSTLVFESGVEDCLQHLETQLDILDPEELKVELAVQAEQLAEFGRMSELESFVRLCQSIAKDLAEISLAEIPSFARRAFSVWQQAHALVILGRIDSIPEQLVASKDKPALEEPLPDLEDVVDLAELSAIQEIVELELNSNTEELDLDDIIPDPEELLEIDDAFTAMDLPLAEASQVDLDEMIPDTAAMLAIDDAFSTMESTSLSGEEVGDGVESADIIAPEEFATTIPIPKQPQAKTSGRMVKVPQEQLKNLNNLASQLILERNASILRLKQLKNDLALTKKRMQRLEQSSKQIRQWYDRASSEGIIAASPEFTPTPATFTPPASAKIENFDALEMDRYGDLHLLFQEQIETIVQLQEVTTDMDLGVREIDRTLKNLTYSTRELQQTITRSQMRPFADLVGRFPRFIRDLATKYNKQVELKIQGESTLLDRQAIELLSDPLNHLVRNAFDHGIEDADTRIAAGKPPQGEIILKAVQRGDRTVITIRDNGRGIDCDRIRDRLCQMGLPKEQIARISEGELLNAIFEPGFSTAEEVSELSGRGVGMDVVSSNLKEIRGEIKVETYAGKGTIFTIAIPLSLLVMRVAILESAGIVFAVPMTSIKEITRLESDIVVGDLDRHSIHWHNSLISLIRLENWLSFQRPSKPFAMTETPKVDVPTVLIFEENYKTQGIYIERYWREQEVVIRPVISPLSLPPGFTGSTVLGDGRVIPIIEPSLFVDWLATQQLAKDYSAEGDRDLVPADNAIDRDGDRFELFQQTEHKTVLIVDDSVNVRRYLALTLERAGYQVEQAKDGQDAVDKLRGGLQVAGIICDIEMPRLDGYGVITAIRSDPNLTGIPIAMLTSRSNHKHRKLAFKLGATAYFSKPFNEQELLQTLDEMMDRGTL